MEDVHRRVAALEAELAALKAEVAASPPAEAEPSRREVFKKLAIAGAGVAAGSVLAQASPVAATDGDPVQIGNETQTAQTPTAIVASGFTGGLVFLADDSSGFTPSAAAFPGALAGWSGTRTGIYGFTSSGAQGIAAVGNSSTSVGLRAQGGKANVHLLASGAAAPLRAVAHVLGELVEDSNGDLWLCVGAGNPGTWRKLAGPATAGSLHLLAAPVRVYDSRPGEPPAVDPKTPLATNTARTIDAKANSSGVPAGAVGVMVTLTVTGSTGAGFLSAWPAGPWPNTSSLNFAAGQTIATTTVSGCGPSATFQVLANQPTNVLVDVIGYYL